MVSKKGEQVTFFDLLVDHFVSIKMTTTGELVQSLDTSNTKTIDYIGNKTESEFTDMRRAAKSVRYSSSSMCRPVSTRRDWQSDTAVRSLVSEQAALARKAENENRQVLEKKEVAIENSSRHMFELGPSNVSSSVVPVIQPTTSLLRDRAALRASVLMYVQNIAQGSDLGVVLSNPALASVITCLFVKSDEELCQSKTPQENSQAADSLFGEETCEDGLIRH